MADMQQPAGEAGFDELGREHDTAVAARDYGKALAAAMKMNDIVEERHVAALRRIASLHLAMGRREDAYVWLRRAVDAGFWDVDAIRSDEGLKDLRDEDPFKSLVRRAWVAGYITMLDRAEREAFQKPEEIMRALAFRPGERVADVGAGSGYFTVRAAEAVGPGGVVWAIDIFQEMLDRIAERTRIRGIGNVRLLKVTREDPQLPPAGVDTVLLVDILHYVQDRVSFAKKLREGLAPGGRVVLIDYTVKPWEERPWGPPPEQQVARETVDADMGAAGLTPLAAYDFLPEQYFVVYGAA